MRCFGLVLKGTLICYLLGSAPSAQFLQTREEDFPDNQAARNYVSCMG
jgi:hypothetical protein